MKLSSPLTAVLTATCALTLGWLAPVTARAQAVNSPSYTATFFADVDKNPKVKKTASGLRYEIITPGAEAKPKATDTVEVKYKGTFIDGKVFDESKGAQTIQFPLNRVIKGWTEGVQLIGPGGKIKLYVPSDLAYGPDGRPPLIPSNSALVFEVELVSIPSAPAAAAPAPAAKPATGNTTATAPAAK